MAALAFLSKAAGEDVSGCDAYSSARTKWLESEGVRFSLGHNARHLEGVDEIIVTPAVSQSDPEYIKARELESSGRAKVYYRGEKLARIVSQRESIAVSGSHGKTTTSTFIARLLAALGEHVVWAIGGETGAFPVAGSANGGPEGGVLVVEADESDGTLALYAPTMLVVTNCEYDHPDHFKTFGEYLACYEAAKSRAKEVVETEALDIQCYSSIRLLGFLNDLPLHNRKNAITAIEIARRRGHPIEAIAAVMPLIVRELPDRRFQKVWPLEGDADSQYGRVIVDYAHHPTEMKCAVEMARSLASGKLRVLFQPHRYSRTKALINDFASAFELADEVVLCPTYAAFEKPIEGGDIADLYAACRGKVAAKLMLAKSCSEAWRHAYLESQEGDVTLLLGAGDIIKIVEEVHRDCALPKRAFSSAEDLARYSFLRVGGKSVGGGKKRIVGCGSNTWISDLTTDEEFSLSPNDSLHIDGTRIVAGAGVMGFKLHIPWMAGIPGTVGGWVAMNAGAFGHSISECVLAVKVDGAWLKNSECAFAYRSSAIAGVIEEVEFSLAGIEGEEEEYLSRRKAFPPRCCGSVFKNPAGDFAGRLLEEALVKGMSVGGAYVWDNHANVIAVREGACASDILALARLMREKVRFKCGVELQPEIKGLEF